MSDQTAPYVEHQTIGVSPKAIAAAAAAYLSPIIVGWLATKVGIKVKVDTATALLGPLILSGITFGSAALARVGHVKAVPAKDQPVDDGGEIVNATDPEIARALQEVDADNASPAPEPPPTPPPAPPAAVPDPPQPA